MFNKNSIRYARIYYKLDEILKEKDKKEELEKAGYIKNGLCIITYPILEYKLIKIINVLKEEGINEIEEAMKIIMQVTKGQQNPKRILDTLKNELGEEK